jgi:hypothetical protein
MPTRTSQKETSKKAKANTSSGKVNALQRPLQPSEALAAVVGPEPLPRGEVGDRREIGGATAVGYFRARSLTEGGYVAWVLRLVEIGAEGEGSCADVVEIRAVTDQVDTSRKGFSDRC